MNVLIIGSGRVGGRLATTLALRGDDVTIIDIDAGALSRLGGHLAVARVQGDARCNDVLATGGIARADGLAAVTGSDELNAVLARLAARVHAVPRVVARIHDPAKAEIYRRLGVQTVAPITWGAARLADVLTTSELTPVAVVGDGRVEIVDVTVPALLAGHQVAELSIAGDTHVVAVTRDGATHLATSTAARLETGDVVHVAVASATQLHALLEHR